MDEYKFTNNWFDWSPPVWSHLKPHLPDTKRFLEIGSFEGKSTVWTIENMISDGGEIICIDTWEGGAEHDKEIMSEVENRFHSNISIARSKFPNRAVFSFKDSSLDALCALNVVDKSEKKFFDFIYIDGSHQAKDVLTDACLCWPLLKKNGFLVFDDYTWKPPGFNGIHRPKMAIDVFTTLFEEELLIAHTGYQFIVKKVV